MIRAKRAIFAFLTTFVFWLSYSKNETLLGSIRLRHLVGKIGKIAFESWTVPIES